MLSWRDFLGTKGTIGSSQIVACGVVMLFPHPFDESCQSFEFTKVFIELFGEVLWDGPFVAVSLRRISTCLSRSLIVCWNSRNSLLPIADDIGSAVRTQTVRNIVTKKRLRKNS